MVVFSRRSALSFLAQDAALVFLSVLVAVMLVRTRALSHVLTVVGGMGVAGSFVAGIFFTSAFTTAPAVVTLGEIAREQSPWLTAFAGALGAMTGDLVIFRFVRDRLSEHLTAILAHATGGRRVRALLKRRGFRWLTFLVGGLIIASPLPDELGVSLLGASKIRRSWFAALSFGFNFVGILLVGFAARSLGQAG